MSTLLFDLLTILIANGSRPAHRSIVMARSDKVLAALAHATFLRDAILRLIANYRCISVIFFAIRIFRSSRRLSSSTSPFCLAILAYTTRASHTFGILASTRRPNFYKPPIDATRRRIIGAIVQARIVAFNASANEFRCVRVVGSANIARLARYNRIPKPFALALAHDSRLAFFRITLDLANIRAFGHEFTLLGFIALVIRATVCITLTCLATFAVFTNPICITIRFDDLALVVARTRLLFAIARFCILIRIALRARISKTRRLPLGAIRFSLRSLGIAHNYRSHAAARSRDASRTIGRITRHATVIQTIRRRTFANVFDDDCTIAFEQLAITTIVTKRIRIARITRLRAIDACAILAMFVGRARIFNYFAFFTY